MFTLLSIIASLLVAIVCIGCPVAIIAAVIYDLCCPYTPLQDHLVFSLQRAQADAWLEESGFITYLRPDGDGGEVWHAVWIEEIYLQSLLDPEQPIPLKWEAFRVDTDGTPVSAWPNPISEEQRLAYLFSPRSQS